MEKKKLHLFRDKAETARTFLFLSCLIAITLLVYIVGTLMLTKDNYITPGNVDTQAEDPFTGCSVSDANCTDTTCGKYSYCGDGVYETCRIYDCGKEYGVYTKDYDGKTATKRVAKPDLTAIAAKKDACSGSMKMTHEGCSGEQTEIDLELTTKDECAVGGFNVNYEGMEGAISNDFMRTGESTYHIIAAGCGKVSSVVPVSQEGIILSPEVQQ